MSERLSGDRIEFDTTQTKSVRRIGQRALEIAEDRYCSGYPDYRGGSIRKLGYNNGRHNWKVGEDSVRLGSAMGFSDSEQELLRATGDAHDIRQLKGRGVDERESADWIKTELLRTGTLPPLAAELASTAILGTEPLFKRNGSIDVQKVMRMRFQTRLHELFAKTVASADLGELYTPMSPYLGHRLYAQHQGLGVGQTPQLDELPDWQEKQIGFLDRYRYPLGRDAERLFATHRRQVIGYLSGVHEQLVRGDIETWEQLLAQDRQFMRTPHKRFV